MGPLHLVDGASVRPAVLDLVVTAARAEPSWLPTVDTASTAALHDWFGRKDPWHSLAACATDGLAVGYLAVRQGTTPLVAAHLSPLAAPHGWAEMCRAVVHPHWRRQGVLSSLVDALGTLVHPSRLWLTCVTGSGAHAAWSRLGFDDVAPVVFPSDVDDRPGTLAVRPISPPGAPAT